MGNLYEDLGVEKGATKAEIKKAYKSLAIKCHPDKDGGDKEEFAKIEKAKRILLDDEKRAQYDRTGSTDKAPSIEDEADQIISQYFTNIIQSGDFKKDLIGRVKSDLIGNKLEGGTALRKQEVILAELKKQADRVASTNELNLFEGIIAQRIEATQATIDQIPSQLKALDKAIEIIDQYKDLRPEVPEIVLSTAFGNSFFITP